jgi:uncharacterized protein (TIGR03435 family)
VASVKPANQKTSDRTPIGMFTYPGGRLNITKYALKMLIESAYGVSEFQVSVVPSLNL